MFLISRNISACKIIKKLISKKHNFKLKHTKIVKKLIFW